VDALAWVTFATAIRRAAMHYDHQQAFKEANELFAAGAGTSASAIGESVPNAEWTWLSRALRAQYRVAALRRAMDSSAAIAVLESEIRRQEQAGEVLHHEDFDTLAALFDDQGAHDKSIEALVRAIELKPDDNRSWRERLLVLARTQAPHPRFTEFLRAAPPLERKVAWDQAKAMYPGIEGVSKGCRA
jgi:tetratricopeptide (TPR) repeat protein